MDAVLAGRDEPATPAEAVAFADLCFRSPDRRYDAARRLYERAFADDPKLADDPAIGNRYNAACAAALAGCGRGADAPADRADRAALREGPVLVARRPRRMNQAVQFRPTGRPSGRNS